jgi:hypothetical protein
MCSSAVELLYDDAGLDVHSKKLFDDRQATPLSLEVKVSNSYPVAIAPGTDLKSPGDPRNSRNIGWPPGESRSDNADSLSL